MKSCFAKSKTLAYFNSLPSTCKGLHYHQIGVYTTNPIHQKYSNRLLLIRGLPGSGKSTLGENLVRDGFFHIEADMYFEFDGTYKFDPTKVRDAHAWCQKQTLNALAEEMDVVVTNTFTQLRELTPYLNMSHSVGLIEAKGSWKNKHDVPESKLAEMAKRWEPVHTIH